MVEEKTIKVYVSCSGDPSAGIWPGYAQLILPDFCINGDHGDREFFRAEITSIFSNWWDDGRTETSFEDECPGCHELKLKCICPVEVS